MAEDTKVEEKQNDVKLSETATKVMELVEKMTVLELADLVKALEEKFGVTASAPVVMAGNALAGGDADDGESEAKSAYDVVITSAGDKKISVIKAVKEIDTSLGLADAKALVDKPNAVVLTGVKPEEAETAKKKLEEAGATVELK